jgi:hypothetical protein
MLATFKRVPADDLAEQAVLVIGQGQLAFVELLEESGPRKSRPAHMVLGLFIVREHDPDDADIIAMMRAVGRGRLATFSSVRHRDRCTRTPEVAGSRGATASEATKSVRRADACIVAFPASLDGRGEIAPGADGRAERGMSACLYAVHAAERQSIKGRRSWPVSSQFIRVLRAAASS